MIWIMGIREADVINTSYISNLRDLMDSGTIHWARRHWKSDKFGMLFDLGPDEHEVPMRHHILWISAQAKPQFLGEAFSPCQD